MEIGVCGGPREWQMLARYRYDYCEGVLAWLASLDEDGFADAKRARAESGLDVACFNGLIPGGFDLYGTEPGDLRAYLSRAFSRAAELGGEIAVLGSGHARRVPVGMEKAEALARFADITYRCGEVAQSFGMKIAIEPLCYREDTLLNTVADGVALCRAVGHPAVGVLLDFYHFRENGESLSELASLPDLPSRLFHVHLARPDSDRGAPTEADVPAMRPWAEALRAMHYTGRISLECVFRSDFKTAIRSAYPATDIFREL